MKRQGQFPVIIISFKGVRGSSYEEIESKISYQIIKLFSNYRYLKRYVSETEHLLEEAEKEQLTRFC
ncbi:MAG: hypothetical protein LN575_03295 [Rickettsia endosymbiont of Gnoriste bilineata]|nr:hypothetical protein [Rickettsia endosymbiont of Gnoriste bilineata]